MHITREVEMIELFDLFSDLNEKTIRKALCIVTVVLGAALMIYAESPLQFILFGLVLILGLVFLFLLIRKDIRDLKNK